MEVDEGIGARRGGDERRGRDLDLRQGIDGDSDSDSSDGFESAVLLYFTSRASIFLRLNLLVGVVSRTFFGLKVL